jgi:hypothetical protein
MWIANFAIEREKENGIIEKMKSVTVADAIETPDRMVGRLMREIYLRNNINVILWQGNINRFLKLVLDDYSAKKAYNDSLTYTAYDFYQFLTEVSTHQSQLQNRIYQTYQILMFVKDFFGLEFLDDVKDVSYEVVTEAPKKEDEVDVAIKELEEKFPEPADELSIDKDSIGERDTFAGEIEFEV